MIQITSKGLTVSEVTMTVISEFLSSILKCNVLNSV